jgi:hypothetical protein
MSGKVAKRIRKIAKAHAKVIAERVKKPFGVVYHLSLIHI